MKFFYLLCCENFLVICLNDGVLFYPFIEGGLGDTIFFAELSLCFTVLMKEGERFSYLL